MHYQISEKSVLQQIIVEFKTVLAIIQNVIFIHSYLIFTYEILRIRNSI